MPLNINPIKELIILIGGPLFQFLAYFLLIIIFKDDIRLVSVYHFGILLFNLLPIYPLDGGKILKIILDLFIPYKKSLLISIYLSYFLVLIIFFNIKELKINIIITISLLIILITKEKRKINYIYNRFVLERYLNNYRFKKSEIVDSINNFYRNKKHLIKDNGNYYFEKDYLKKKYTK